MNRLNDCAIYGFVGKVLGLTWKISQDSKKFFVRKCRLSSGLTLNKPVISC